MAITNIPIMGIGNGTGSSQSEARLEAVNEMIDSIFANVNTMLSSHFTRVATNTTKFDGSKNYNYRESYKFNANSNKYLIVEFKIQSTIGNGTNYNNIPLHFKLCDGTAETSTSMITSIFDVSIEQVVTISQSNADGVYFYNISITFPCITFDNENVYLMACGNDKQSLAKNIGIITINNKDYIAYTSNNTSKTFTLYDENGVIYYTNSTIIAGSNGTGDSGYIMTLPIYLSNGNTATSQIYKDLKFENALQTTNNSCSYGGIYNIGGVDYFAIGNNFLLKM